LLALPCMLQVGTLYDPMVAKLVCHGPDRASALARLHAALGQLQVRSLVAAPAGLNEIGLQVVRWVSVLSAELTAQAPHHLHLRCCQCLSASSDYFPRVESPLQIAGFPNNVNFLSRICENEEFQQASSGVNQADGDV